jgi:hypothetical protein
VNEGNEAPGLLVVEIGGGHVRARNALSNRIKNRLIAERMPQRALYQIRPARAAAAVGPVTAAA